MGVALRQTWQFLEPVRICMHNAKACHSEERSDEESLHTLKICLFLASKRPFAIAQGDMTINVHACPEHVLDSLKILLYNY